MRIRFLVTIPTAAGAFQPGQVIDVAVPTPDLLAWLEPTADGTRRAEVVRDVPEETAIVVEGERAITKRGRHAARRAQADYRAGDRAGDAR